GAPRAPGRRRGAPVGARARDARRRARAGGGGGELDGDQSPVSRASDERLARRVAARAPVPVRGGVRSECARAPRARAGGRRRSRRGEPGTAAPMTLAELVAHHSVVITAGSGGVGKTTVAATIGLWGALTGRRVAVLTIDPARRLATSLGLESLGSEP